MKWKFYDADQFNEEMAAIERGDRAKLVVLMDLYTRIGATRPVVVESYGEGFHCLRHISGAYKGWRLFFVESSGDLVALLVYRKEFGRVDPRLVERARRLHEGVRTMNEFERIKESLCAKDPAFADEYAASSLVGDLVAMRAMQGLTQAEVAQRAGLTQSAVARIEGLRSNVTLLTLMKYAAAVGSRIEAAKPAGLPGVAKLETRGRSRLHRKAG